MAFKDLTQVADRAIELPMFGTVVKVPPLSAELGPVCQMVFDALFAMAVAEERGVEPEIPEPNQEVLDALDENNFWEQVVGGAWPEMKAAGAAWPDLKRAAFTVMADACHSRALAEAIWNGEDLEGKAPNRAARRAASRSGTARTTRSRASTSGTTSRSTPRPAKKPTPSRGRKSSTAGST